MSKSYSSSAILKHLKAGTECACLAVFETCHRRAYAPTSNTASHDNQEKIISWVSYMGMGLRLAHLVAWPSGLRRWS